MTFTLNLTVELLNALVYKKILTKEEGNKIINKAYNKTKLEEDKKKRMKELLDQSWKSVREYVNNAQTILLTLFLILLLLARADHLDKTDLWINLVPFANTGFLPLKPIVVAAATYIESESMEWKSLWLWIIILRDHNPNDDQ